MAYLFSSKLYVEQNCVLHIGRFYGDGTWNPAHTASSPTFQNSSITITNSTGNTTRFRLPVTCVAFQWILWIQKFRHHNIHACNSTLRVFLAYRDLHASTFWIFQDTINAVFLILPAMSLVWCDELMWRNLDCAWHLQTFVVGLIML